MAVGYVPGNAARLACGVAVAAGFLALALLARRSPTMHSYWEIPLAFFGMALFVLADRYVPGFLANRVLPSPPVPGNPLASTIPGTVVVELVELLLTVLAVVVVVWISRSSLASIYVHRGRFGRAYVIGIVGFVAFYVLTFSALSHSRFMPVHGGFDLGRYLSLTPALLAAVAANGFLEELMFRGLLMSRLNIAFGPYPATFIQAAIFASWHVGVTYTSAAVVFIVLVTFPLGLLCGYLTRSSGSIIPSSLFHAGADLPIYLAFLSYIS
ncbi:CPBP family intramembrane glutamic endopeptidase [Arthrobacter dokdonensis]|uniref:CPBP family intramembrane glutamic endopeptidase n=1 Tax=Arthrobacter dokdonellae TaxID=2211210 RepID=UPI0014940537|nr:CPBP family intramembrane glutamic endopeptidase [Arthrobacter dokdonellae]